MQDNEAIIEEKPATHRKDVQRWLLFTVGLIGIFLFILTVLSIINRADSTVDDGQGVSLTTPEDLGTNNDQFNAIKTPFQSANDTFLKERSFSEVEKSQGKENPKDSVSASDFEKHTNEITQKMDKKSLESPQKTPLEQAIEQWELQEELRGLNSARTTFSLNQKESATAFSVADSSSANDEVSDISNERVQIRKKIEEAQRFRSQLLEGEESDQSYVQQKLKNINDDFDEPPENISGYSKENDYNADIAGKIALSPGTTIDAIFTQTTVSDYAGSVVKGMVSHDVYGPNKQFVLMPKGTKLILKSLRVNNVNEPIQARMGFIVTWAVLPDGKKIDFSRAVFMDREGVGAIKDKVNRHLMAQFLGVGAYALLSSESSREGTGLLSDNEFEGELGESYREQFAPMAAKYLSLVPTIKIRNGQTFKLILEDEIYVDPWKDIYEEYYN